MKNGSGISTRALIAGIAAVVLFAAALGIGLWLTRPESPKVLVTVNGQEYATFDLNTDRTVTIGPVDGGWYNVLRIENGRAAVIESDCDNQICVHTPALREDAIGIIVCLPHGVAVELK